MELFNEERSAQVVGASFANTPDPRLRSLLTALTEHLHAFIKEVQLTGDEWATAVDFLTRTGHLTDDRRLPEPGKQLTAGVRSDQQQANCEDYVRDVSRRERHGKLAK